MKLVPLDKYGWPVERIRNRPITNALRLVLHARKVVTAAEWERRQDAMVFDGDCACETAPPKA